MSEDQGSNGKAASAPRLAASTSFTDDEVEALHQLIKAILGNRDCKVLMKHKAFARIASKVLTMKRSIEVQRERRAAWFAERGAKQE